MSLVADYNSSSSTSLSDNTDDEVEPESSKNTKFKLPEIKLKDGNKTNTLVDMHQRKLKLHSVYSNPYVHGEENVMSILSKHTQLSEQIDESQKIKNTFRKSKKEHKPCLHFFKKGTCKYGETCKFLHHLSKDEDKVTVNKQPDKHIQQQPDLVGQPSISEKLKKQSMKRKNLQFHEPCVVGDTDDELWETGKQNGMSKKHVGIVDNIIPCKRALKSYEKLSK